MAAIRVAIGELGMHPVNVRNLEQIQEDDGGSRPTRLGALLLASIGGAALVSVSLVVARREGPPARAPVDPLAELAKASKPSGPPAEKLDESEVTFPALLSDSDQPTTALAAVKDERGRLIDPRSEAPTTPATAPPPPTDRLPVVPLPVGTLIGSTPVTTAPKDPLTALARTASTVSDTAALAPPGSDGGYQLQVASYKDQADADKLVEDLRRRGHRAFRQAAYVPDRGLWHRVRIGPFRTKFEAAEYKVKFERSERLSPFLVDPEKVKRAEELRALRQGGGRHGDSD